MEPHKNEARRKALPSLDITFRLGNLRQRDGTTGRAIKGQAPGIRKLILVSEHADQTPAHNEIWRCLIVHDSQPDQPTKGVLFVIPVAAKKQELKFSIWNGVSDEIDAGEPVILVEVKVRRNENLVSLGTHVVRSTEDIVEDWPDYVKRDVAARLRSNSALHDQWLALSAEKLVRNFEQEPPPKPNLAEVETVEWSVSMDGKVPKLCPKLVRTVRNGYGNVKAVSSTPCVYSPTYIAFIDEMTKEQAAKIGAIIESYSARAAILNSKEQQKLDRKALFAALTRDENGKIRFQWAGDFLTEGTIWFPRVRPKGTEWQKYPIEAVPEGYWDTFLTGLKGKLLFELLPYHEQGIWRRPTQTRIPLTERQRDIAEIIKKEIATAQEREMWQGDGVDSLAIGKCVVFTVRREKLPDLYVVDNPGPGAIYLFEEKDEALNLAQGRITRTELRKLGAKRIHHVSGWKQELARALSTWSRK